mgnify:FL=1
MHFENDDVSTEGHPGPTPPGAGPTPPRGGAGEEPRPEEEATDIRARLEEIDKRIAELRATMENQLEGPGDQVDAAATLTLQDEIMMMIETLENEKRRLLDRLRER